MPLQCRSCAWPTRQLRRRLRTSRFVGRWSRAVIVASSKIPHFRFCGMQAPRSGLSLSSLASRQVPAGAWGLTSLRRQTPDYSTNGGDDRDRLRGSPCTLAEFPRQDWSRCSTQLTIFLIPGAQSPHGRGPCGQRHTDRCRRVHTSVQPLLIELSDLSG
jgi:hypothetical protein